MTVVRPSRLQRDGLFGLLTAVFVLAMVRGVTGAVTLVEPAGQRRTLTRESSDEISVTVVGGGRYRKSALTIAGSGTVLPLSYFSLAEVQRQFVANGWRFTRPGRRAVR
jgi:hypothetical protein